MTWQTFLTDVRDRSGLLLVVALLAGAWPLRGDSPKFYRDDPLTREPETQDASNVQARDVELVPDLLLNLFTRPGDPNMNVRAQDLNTIDEVPDSSWFTNRIGTRQVTVDEITRGPNTTNGPAPGGWTIIRAKVAGFSPGFTIRDSHGDTWFIQFDSNGNARAATGAVAVACRLFWALGYNQVESYVARLDPRTLRIDPKATVEPRPGHKRPMRQGDINRILDRAEKDNDG